jgi:hypothetical protein
MGIGRTFAFGGCIDRLARALRSVRRMGRAPGVRGSFCLANLPPVYLGAEGADYADLGGTWEGNFPDGERPCRSLLTVNAVLT